MNAQVSLQKIIIEFLAQAKFYDLPCVCEKYGIECDQSLDPSKSKKTYLRSGLAKKNAGETREIAKQIILEGCEPSFVHDAEPYLNDDFFVISMEKRRGLLNWLSFQPNLEENVSILKLLSGAWDLDNTDIIGWDGLMYNAREYITQHMIRNDDITYEELFENLLDFMYIPDRQLFRLIETIVNPPARFGESQTTYVKEINEILDGNCYRLITSRNIAGNPIYHLEKCYGTIEGEICNIIFGSVDGKPDVVIEDALTNRLDIHDNDGKCLFYTMPIGTSGLSWHDLVTWWNDGNESYDLPVEQSLVTRLIESLDSPPEVLFLRTYYNYVYKQNNNGLPALIPQVYCHYDPQSAKMRGGKVFVHQRMDFLILPPGGARVVIEIDGKQHYSNDDGAADPHKYAEMVADDRELKLYGYDVYRFGGYEFCNEKDAIKKIETFLLSLYSKYGVL